MYITYGRDWAINDNCLLISAAHRARVVHSVTIKVEVGLKSTGDFVGREHSGTRCNYRKEEIITSSLFENEALASNWGDAPNGLKFLSCQVACE